MLEVFKFKPVSMQGHCIQQLPKIKTTQTTAEQPELLSGHGLNEKLPPLSLSLGRCGLDFGTSLKTVSTDSECLLSDLVTHLDEQLAPRLSWVGLPPSVLFPLFL